MPAKCCACASAGHGQLAQAYPRVSGLPGHVSLRRIAVVYIAHQANTLLPSSTNFHASLLVAKHSNTSAISCGGLLVRHMVAGLHGASL